MQGLPLTVRRRCWRCCSETALWRPVLAGLQLRPLAAGETMVLGADLQITAVAVPHRDEWGVGTVAFHVHGPRRTLLYLPDIDAGTPGRKHGRGWARSMSPWWMPVLQHGLNWEGARRWLIRWCRIR